MLRCGIKDRPEFGAAPAGGAAIMSGKNRPQRDTRRMNVCLIDGLKEIVLAAGSITLAWSHAVEKTRWEEDWLVGVAGFHLVEARLEGPGAGMVPPEGAVFDGRVWRWHPRMRFQEDRLVLARSGAAGGTWEICAKGECRAIPETDAAGPAILKPCP